MFSFIGIFSVTTLVVSLAGSAVAQTFPAKPLRIVTQFVPGSSGDTALRFITPPMSEALGQPVVIDSRPGAGGVVAAEQVMRAAGDGYTLLSSTSGAHIMRLFLVKNQSFDPVTAILMAAGFTRLPLNFIWPRGRS